MDREEVIESFKAITHASHEKTEFYLSAADWDLQKAVDMFLARALHFPDLAYRYSCSVVLTSQECPEHCESLKAHSLRINSYCRQFHGG
jgi:hypothetical protein